MAEVSTKPYFIRAIYEWCSDCGYTPYLSVKVDDRTRVPVEYVKNGEIVLNVSLNATRNLTINNELIQFSARFNGVSREVSIPVDRVQAKVHRVGVAYARIDPRRPAVAKVVSQEWRGPVGPHSRKG